VNPSEVLIMETIIRENFKKLRRGLGITQEAMASFLQLEQSSISKFESGERTLNVSNLEKACLLFGIPYQQLSNQKYESHKFTPSFRKTNVSNESLEAISEINQIALNIIEMKRLLDKTNG
jgi:transcriptional regulator with XRE-family HTH domain